MGTLEACAKISLEEARVETRCAMRLSKCKDTLFIPFLGLIGDCR